VGLSGSIETNSVGVAFDEANAWVAGYNINKVGKL
jgi:hypothetical protein